MLFRSDRGVEFGHVTLHVGAGTFQPMRVDNIHEHRMHSEWLNVGAALVEQVRATRARGGRVVAVGTTVVRALESAMRDGELQPFAGETQIFIFPGYRIRSVDAEAGLAIAEAGVDDVTYQYTDAVNGFAADLSADEAAALRRALAELEDKDQAERPAGGTGTA